MFVWDGVQKNIWQDPDFIRRYENYGEPILVGDSGRDPRLPSFLDVMSRDDNDWPVQGKLWSLDQVIDFCKANGHDDLADYILGDPPERQFVSDGCSGWVDRWFGLNLYPHCRLHDIWYWAGRPRDRKTRRQADDQLLKAISDRGRPVGAGMMWFGVRLFGGSWLKNKSFSWGFGRLT